MVFIIAILLPLVPLYVLIVAVFLVIYCIVVYHLFKKLQKLNAETAGAQNRLSGELSDSITNILAVKTSGREQYERDLFGQINKEVYVNDSRRMRGTLFSGAVDFSDLSFWYTGGGITIKQSISPISPAR